MNTIVKGAKMAPKLRIIPLGGLEEIGKNMTALEYGDDIVVIDMGLLFPRVDMPGVDYLIPDVTYLEQKKSRIRGVIITHGHLDHTGATPYLIGKLGFPPIYGTAITLGFVKNRLEEFGLVEKCRFIEVKEEGDNLQFGSIRINTFRLLHNIPGEIGLEIETPNGRVVFCTDWKFDYNPADGKGMDFQALASIGTKGVDLLLSDSTNADKPGHCVSEKTVEESLAMAIEGIKGRLVIAMFASLLTRIQQVLNIAAKNDRKVYLSGRSLVQNVEMAVELGAITVPPGTIIEEREVSRYPAEKLIVLATGSQSEEHAALVRMSQRKHRIIKLRKSDTVMISASIIPGKEAAVGELKSALHKTGATVISHKYLDVDIHASGHAHQEDLKLMIALMRPKYFMPMHGEIHHLRIHRELAEEVGVAKENIISGENGSVLEMHQGGRVTVSNEKVPFGLVAIDGLGVGDVNADIVRERQEFGREGFVNINCLYDLNTKTLVSAPLIVSHGFVNMDNNEKLAFELQSKVASFVQTSLAENKLGLNEIQERLKTYTKHLLFDVTGRDPVIIPVITGV